MIRVGIVDDQALVREGLRVLLERADDITVVGDASDGDAGVRMASALRPDVLLMDVRMPGTDGLTATQEITADPTLVDVHVVVLTTFDDDESILRAMRIGAAGFLLKDIGPEQLREAVRIVAAGDALLSPAVTRRVMRAAASGARVLDTGRLVALTERERQVLTCVGEGLSNNEIADRMVISPATVRTHVGRLLAKLVARDRAQLVIIAYESGLVVPGQGG